MPGGSVIGYPSIESNSVDHVQVAIVYAGQTPLHNSLSLLGCGGLLPKRFWIGTELHLRCLLIRGIKLTYEDLVREYVRLNETTESFAKIPHGRFINFVSDFMAAEKGATRDEATRAWKKLKALDVPKTYGSWVTSQDAAQPAVADGRAPRLRSGSRR